MFLIEDLPLDLKSELFEKIKELNEEFRKNIKELGDEYELSLDTEIYIKG